MPSIRIKWFGFNMFKQDAHVFLSFCLACYGKQDIYWIGFVSDLGLYRRKTSQQGTILVPGPVAPKRSRTWTSPSIVSSGSSCPIFYNGV